MTKKARSEAEVNKVKNKILQEALQILTDEGYDNLSMSKLGKRTKMTAANLYNYYGSKDELYSAIIISGYNHLYKMINEALDHCSTPFEKVEGLITALYEFGMKNPHYHYLIFTMIAPKYSDYVGTPMESIALEELENAFKVLEFSIGVFDEYIKDHLGYKGLDSKLVTIQFWTQVHGIVSLYNSGNLIEADENAEQIAQLILANIISIAKKGFN